MIDEITPRSPSLVPQNVIRRGSEVTHSSWRPGHSTATMSKRDAGRKKRQRIAVSPSRSWPYRSATSYLRPRSLGAKGRQGSSRGDNRVDKRVFHRSRSLKLCTEQAHCLTPTPTPQTFRHYFTVSLSSQGLLGLDNSSFCWFHFGIFHTAFSLWQMRLA